MTLSRSWLKRFACGVLVVVLLPGCVYYNTLYLARRYYNRSFDEVPYALDKNDLSTTPQFPRAIELSKKALANYPRSKYRDDAYLLWAKSLIGSDDPRQAIRMLEDFDTAHPKSSITADATFYLGVAEARARKYEPALKTFDDYLARFPKHSMVPYAYYERSRVLLSLGRPGEAAQSVTQVIERYSRSKLALRARIARGEALVAQKSFDAAREDFRYLGNRAITDDERLDYLLREADCLEGAMKYDEAISLLKDALAHVHEPARVDTTGGRFAQAPTGPGANDYGRLKTRMGTVLLRSNHLEDAIASYQRVIEDYPRTPVAAEAQYRLGYAYETSADDFDKARVEYAKVRDIGAGSSFTDQAASRVASIDRLSEYRKTAVADTLEHAAQTEFLVAEQYLFQLDKPARALEEYRKIETNYTGSAWAGKAINAQGWVLSRKLGQKTAADSLFWRVVREYPGTEAQLAARDYLEFDGQEVPTDLIRLPERVVSHADSVAALAAAAVIATADSAAHADSLSHLTPIPQGSIPLGGQAVPGINDSLRLGTHGMPRAMQAAPAPTDSTNLFGEGGALRAPGGATPGSRDTVFAAPPDTTHVPPPAAPPDTTRVLPKTALPDTTHVLPKIASPDTTHVLPKAAPADTTKATAPKTAPGAGG